MTGGVRVRARLARAWAAACALSVASIAERKHEGLLEAGLAAPAAPQEVFLHLQERVAAVDPAVADDAEVVLDLPEHLDVVRYVLYTTAVNAWLEGLHGAGLLPQIVDEDYRRFDEAVASQVCADRCLPEADPTAVLHPDAVLLVDARGRVRSADAAARVLLGDDVVGRLLAAVLPYEHVVDFFQTLLAADEDAAPPVLEHPVRGPRGLRDVETTVAVALDDPSCTCLVLAMRDVTRRRQEDRRHAQRARTDALTGLVNRHALLERLQQELAHGARDGTAVAVAVVDLDRFKPVNDTWGHDVGDAVLVELARRLDSCARRTDVVARTGGDEFVVVMGGLRDEQRAQDVTRRIAEEMSRPVRVGDVVAHVGASIGTVSTSEVADDAAGLLREADQRMYRVKRTRRRLAPPTPLQRA